MIHSSAFVHPKAHVEPDKITVGAGTRIYQFASVTRGTVLGEDCVVWPHALLDGPIIGDRCKIASGVAMGPGFKLGNDIFVAPNVVFANDMWPATASDGFDEEKLRNGKHFCIIVEDGASIGAGAVILPGVTIGARAVIAAGAVVDENVGRGALWQRNGQLGLVPNNRSTRRMHYAEAIETAIKEGTMT